MKKINKYIDIYSGGFWLIMSLIMYGLTFTIEQRASVQNTVGPQFIPQIIAILLFISSILVVTTGISKNKKGIGEKGSFPEEKKEISTVVLTIITIFAFAFLLTTLGFIISSALYLFIQLSLFNIEWKKHIIKNAIISVVVPTVCYMLFRYVFSLTLPTGIFF